MRSLPKLQSAAAYLEHIVAQAIDQGLVVNPALGRLT